MWKLIEVPESTQRHVRLKQIELALFTLCDGSFVFCDMAADISAQVRVRRQITRSICRVGPVVGSGLPVGSTLVVSPTYELQHYKTNKMVCAQRTLRSNRAYAQSNQSSQCAWVAGPLHADIEDWSDWADVQADPSLRLVQRSFFGLVVLPVARIKASHAVKSS